MTDSHHSLDVATSNFDIVADLLENDLVGLLLSTSHLQRYCMIRAQKVDLTCSGALLTLASCPVAATKFQQDAMRQFIGLHISECIFSTPQELSFHLDEKLRLFFEDDLIEVKYMKFSDEIEMAWKYRRACQGSRL